MPIAAIDLPDVFQIRQELQADKRSSASRAAALFQQSSPQAEPGILHSRVATARASKDRNARRWSTCLYCTWVWYPADLLRSPACENKRNGIYEDRITVSWHEAPRLSLLLQQYCSTAKNTKNKTNTISST